MEEKDISLALHLEEDEKYTVARALLDVRGDHFEARGLARRNPDDHNVPVIGEELAIARALMHLQNDLLEAAQDKIERWNA